MNNWFKSLAMFAMSILFLLLSQGTVLACSCSPPKSVDIAYDLTANIAVFRVEGVDEATVDGGNESRKAKLIVERVFKGNIKVGETFVFSNFGPCTITFSKRSIGKQYLLYLGDRPKEGAMWWARQCSRSGTLSGTANDVRYMEALEQVRGKTRLSGSVSQQVEYGDDLREWTFDDLAGLEVRIRGKGKDITLRTDDYGAYEIYGLPPGDYQITLPRIEGYSTNYSGSSGDPTLVNIVSKKHTEKNFYYSIDNSVSGTLLDGKGLPIEGVCLDLLPTTHDLPSYLRENACTDRDGKFQFTEILSGKYILVGNKENVITHRNPFSRFYYPNVQEVSKSPEFSLAPGIHISGVVLTAPPSDFIALNGVLRFSDGKPVVKGDVQFYPGIEAASEIKDRYPDLSARTDENGKFRIRVKAGESGILIGSFTANKNEFRKCPQIMKILEAGPLSWDNIKTSPVLVSPEFESGPIELKFPFPACQKVTNKPTVK